MNNMQFDEATQTYRGAVGPYRWNGEEHGQPFTAFRKPLRVTPEWIAQSYLDGFAGFASYWQDQSRNEQNWESFAAKPWAYMQQTANPHIQPSGGAVQQLIQAMAGFAPMGAGQVQESVAGLFSAIQLWGVDGGT